MERYINYKATVELQCEGCSCNVGGSIKVRRGTKKSQVRKLLLRVCHALATSIVEDADARDEDRPIFKRPSKREVAAAEGRVRECFWKEPQPAEPEAVEHLPI